MSNADWYRRKLLGKKQAQPQQYTPNFQRQPATPPTQPIVQPGSLELTPIDQDKDGKTHIVEAMGYWRGDKNGALTEKDNCPKCGSRFYFSRTKESLMKPDGTRVAPAPKCSECGYNGLFEQYGDLFDTTGNRI